MVLGPAHNDAAVRLAQAQRVMDAPWCLHWARQIVRAKLLRQRKTLRTWQAARPDARKPLSDALARLDTALVTLDAADPAPLDAASLRGLEGRRPRPLCRPGRRATTIPSGYGAPASARFPLPPAHEEFRTAARLVHCYTAAVTSPVAA